MSEDVDRNKVFQTTRVRTALKNDVSWIQKSKQDKKEEDKAKTDQATETRPVPVRQNSYVLSAAKKFETKQVTELLSYCYTWTRFRYCRSKNSANQENGYLVIPPQKDAQPVETTDVTKSQAPTEELIQSGVAQPGKSVTNTTAENKAEHADTAVYQSNVKHNEGAAEVSAEVHVEEQIQNDEAQPEKSVVNTTAENEAEHADTAVYQSNVKHNEGAAEVSAEVHVEEQIQNDEAQPASSTKEHSEAVSPVEPAEQPAANTTAENKGECADTTVDQSNVEHSEAKVSADAQAETSAAAEVTPAEVPAAPAVELKPEEKPSNETEPANATHLEDAGVKSTVQHAEGSCEICPPEQATEEIVEAAAEVVVESSPDKSVVINATPGEEAARQDSVEPVTQSLAGSVSELPTQPAAETTTEGSCEKGPAEQAAGETVAAVAEVSVESSTETPAVTHAAGEEAALQDSVEPVPDPVPVADTVSESPTQPAAETAVKSVKCEVESAASAEPVLKTRAEECEVQPVDNTVVEQSVEPTSESAADRAVELSIKDAVEPVTDAETAQDTFTYRVIELTDALDEETPTAEAGPEPLKDPKQSQSHTEGTKLSQQSDDTNTSETFQKPVEEPRSSETLNATRDTKIICSFCDKIIDGTVKITFSEPLVNCHPECLKCGACAKALGDLLTPMFLHDQVIQCDGCFAKTLKT